MKMIQITHDALSSVVNEAIEDAAKVCEQMVVSGRQTPDQKAAATALEAAAGFIRALKQPPSTGDSQP
jgi:bisphosphoglycerate-independent phosphoglycerate mutase (AlkP superfamily)